VDDGRMFYPASGVVCDRAAQVCYDQGRANVAATQRYLGDGAARNLSEGSKDARKEPKWVFEPDGETSCDMRTQVCYGPKGPNVNKTRKYFGDAAGACQQSLGAAGTIWERRASAATRACRSATTRTANVKKTRSTSARRPRRG
jgi:hypothetical protein